MIGAHPPRKNIRGSLMLDLFHHAHRLLTGVQGSGKWRGLPLIGILVFAEAGLFVAFFLHSDFMLACADVFAPSGQEFAEYGGR
jgi:hypothetical protein